MEYFI
jgi:hypothetical protein